MSKIIKLILIGLSYIIATLITAILSPFGHQLIYFTGYIVLGIGIYKVLKLSLQFATKHLKKIKQ